MKRTFLPVTLLLLLAGAGVWVAVGTANTTVAAKKKTHTITCRFFARPTTVGGVEGKAPKFIKKTITVTVETTDGPVPEIARITKPKVAELDDFRILVQHNTNSLTVAIYEKSTKRLISSRLYQFGPDLRNQFHGGHGFTGLNYVYHSKSKGELQFWCAVK